MFKQPQAFAVDIPQPSQPVAISTVSSTSATSSASSLAYGGGGVATASAPISAGSLYRLERGAPYRRKGKVVFATPQFKALAIYTPTTQTAQIPGTNQQGVTAGYPTKTK